MKYNIKTISNIKTVFKANISHTTILTSIDLIFQSHRTVLYICNPVTGCFQMTCFLSTYPDLFVAKFAEKLDDTNYLLLLILREVI